MLGLLAYGYVLTVAVLLLLQKSGLGSKPEEVVTCLPCLRAGAVMYMDLQITTLLGFHLTALFCWLFYFSMNSLS